MRNRTWRFLFSLFLFLLILSYNCLLSSLILLMSLLCVNFLAQKIAKRKNCKISRKIRGEQSDIIYLLCSPLVLNIICLNKCGKNFKTRISLNKYFSRLSGRFLRATYSDQTLGIPRIIWRINKRGLAD